MLATIACAAPYRKSPKLDTPRPLAHRQNVSRGIEIARKSLMQYHALAADYDGTLATHGVVDEKTIEALHRLRESGRRLILVTGRIIEQLLQVIPQVGLCDLVVADNGALLFDPKTGEKYPLAERPPQEFIEELARRGVPRIEVG